MHMQDHDKCRSYTFLTKRKGYQIYEVYVKSVANHTYPHSQF
jgi:hypothetical protein